MMYVRVGKWFGSIWGRKRDSGPAGERRRRCRVLLEALEDRLAPAVIQWDGGPAGTGTDWHNPVNWVGDRLPGPQDDALVVGDRDIRATSGVTVNRLTGDARLDLAGGIFSVAAASSVRSLSIGLPGAAEFTGSGNLTINGRFNWFRGRMTGTGTTFANGDVNLFFGGPEAKVLGRHLQNARTATLRAVTFPNSNIFTISAGATWTNLPGAAFRIETRFGAVSGTGAFVNQAGATLSLDGVSSIGFSPALTNSGLVTAFFGGRLFLSSAVGGAHTGTFRGSLVFAGGTHDLRLGSSVSANMEFSGGTVHVRGNYDGLLAGEVRFSGAIVTFHPEATLQRIGATLWVTGGSVTFNSGESLTPTTLNLIGGTLAGSDNLTVSGLFTWRAGTLGGTGTATALGGITMQNGAKTLGRALSNNSTTPVVLDGASNSLTIAPGAAWTNASGAVFDIRNAQGIFGGGAFVNQAGATLRRSVSSSALSFQPVLTNAGTVDVQTGTLSLSGGGTHAGSFTVAPSASTSLAFAGGTHDLLPSSRVTSGIFATVAFGGGTVHVRGTYNVAGFTTVAGAAVTFHPSAALTGIGLVLNVSGGTATFNSGEALAVQFLRLFGGTLGGSDNLTATGEFTWGGGTLGGTGTLFADNNVNMSAGDARVLARPLLNRRGADLAGGALTINPGGVWTNVGGASFNTRNNVGVFGGGGFVNQAGATLRTLDGAGQTAFQPTLTNGGTIEVLTGTLSLTGGGAHDLQAGSRLTGAAGAAVFFGGGTVQVRGGYDVAGTTTVSRAAVTFHPTATLTRVGTALTVQEGGTATFNSGEGLTVSSLLLNGTLNGSDAVTINGPFTWSGGTLGGTGMAAANGGVDLTLGLGKTLARPLNHRGTAVLTGTNSTLTIAAGATFTNLAGATFEVRGGPGVLGGGTFVNQAGAVLRGAAGALTIPFQPLLTNGGTVEVQTGGLRLDGGGTHAGSFTLAAGNLLFGGGIHDLQASSRVAAPAGAAGQVLFSGGTVTVSGTYDVASGTHAAGAAVTFQPAATLTRVGRLVVGGGSAAFNSGEALVPSALVLSGGTLSGSDPLTIGGQFDWFGGTLAGPGTASAAGVNMIAGAGKVLARNLTNTGFAGLGAGSFLTINAGAVWTNAAGAVFEVRNDQGVLGGGAFVNQAGATLRRAAGAGTATFQPTLTNAGTLEIQTGTLNLTGGFSNFNAATGTLTGGTYVVAGTFGFQNALLVTNAASLVLDGPAAAIVNHVGADALAALATNAAGGALTLRNGIGLFTPGDFSNAGAVTVEGGSYLYTPATIRNSGTTAIGGGSFLMAETDYVQTAGLTTLADGLLLANTVDLEGGALSGSGIVYGNVRNAARLAVGGAGAAGYLYVFGGYTQLAAGSLDLEVGGLAIGAEHDYLYVDGAATLGGTLNLRLLNGYLPAPDDAFALLTFNGRTGDFATINGLEVSETLAFFPFADDFGYYLFAYLR